MTDTVPQGEARIRMRKLVGWGAIGQLSYVVSQFILLIALARFSSVAEVGHFGFANALIAPVYYFFGLGLRTNQSTDIVRQFNFREFLFLRAVTTTTAYLLILILAFTVLDPATRYVTIVFGAAKAAETFSDLFYGFFQRAERIEYVARSLTLRGFGSALLFAAILATTGNTALAFGALLLVWTLVALFVDYLPARRLATREGDTGEIKLKSVYALAKSSLPLGINALVIALQTSLPRYIIGWTIGITALGQFTVVAYAMQASVMVTTAIGNSISPRLAFYFLNGNRRAFFVTLRKLVVLVVALGVIGACIGLLFGNWLLETVFGADYSNLGLPFAICILAAALRAGGIMLQSGLFASRNFHLNMILRIISTCVMFVACFVGAWTGGLVGVAWGMAATFSIHSIALWLVLQRRPFPAVKNAGTA